MENNKILRILQHTPRTYTRPPTNSLWRIPFIWDAPGVCWGSLRKMIWNTGRVPSQIAFLLPPSLRNRNVKTNVTHQGTTECSNFQVPLLDAMNLVKFQHTPGRKKRRWNIGTTKYSPKAPINKNQCEPMSLAVMHASRHHWMFHHYPLLLVRNTSYLSLPLNSMICRYL